MARSTLAWILVSSLLVALLPAALGQSAPAIEPGAEYTILTVQIPLVGLSGGGNAQVPIDGGILELEAVPVPLEGPGGEVDAGVFVVDVMYLLPSGVRIPLPSMTIRSSEQAIDGPAAQSLADLAAQIAILRAELEALATPAEPEPEPEPAPEPEPEPQGPSPIDLAIEQAQTDAEALAAEAAWLQAFADEAAGVTSEGAAEQVAIAGSMVARIMAGLELVEQGLDGIEYELEYAQGLVPAPPSSSSTSSSSSSSSSTSSQSTTESSSSSSSTSPPPSVTPPDPAPALAELQALLDQLPDAQEEADGAIAAAAEAWDELVGLGAEQLAEAMVRLQETQAAIDGARVAAEEAAQPHLENAAFYIGEIQQGLADRTAEGQALADEAADHAVEQVEFAIAHIQWAQDWLAAAQAYGDSVTEGSLSDAQASLASANRTAHALLDITERYASQQAPDPDEPAMPDLSQAEEAIAAAQADLDAAASAAQDAIEFLGSVPGGLDPIAPPESPLESLPLSVDADALAICIDHEVSQSCFQYEDPDPMSPRSLTVAVAIPVGLGGLPPVSDPSIPTSAPEPSVPPAPPVPVPSTPSLPGTPGLPGVPSSSASSSSSSASSSNGSTSESSSSSPSGSEPQPDVPRLVVDAQSSALALRAGEQSILAVTVRNDGSAADSIQLTTSTDAPIAIDMTEGSVSLAAGEEKELLLRITPLEAGSGNLQVLATGAENTATDDVAVEVAAAQPASNAAIVASLDPTAFEGAVGQASAITVRIANQAAMADTVRIAVSANGVKIDPAVLEVALKAGEAATRQVWLTPTQQGPASVKMLITSTEGADLQPVLLLEGVGSLAPSSARPPTAMAPEPADDKPKDTPGLGIIAVSAAVALAFFAMRRRLAK